MRSSLDRPWSPQSPGTALRAWVAAFLWTLSLVMVSPIATPRAWAEVGRTVDQIAVEGNKRVEAEAILRNVKQRKGDPLDEDQVSRDLRAIYGLGYFEDIQVESRVVDGKLALVFVVKEKPSIESVSLAGNDEIDEEDIQEVLDLKPFSILDISRLKDNEEKIRKLYADKGFFLTEVEAKVAPSPDDPEQVRVTFQIEEYTKVQVREISFLGIKALQPDELINIMETRPGSFFSFLTNFGVFKETSFEADLERITAYYYNQGYINVKVDQPQLRLSQDKQYLFITIPISEGEQHTLESTALTGDFLRPKEELEAMLTLKPDPAATERKVFSYGDMRTDITRIKDLYQDEGYAWANVNPIPRINAKDHSVALTYDLQKGPKVYFGRIEVVGNSKTRDKVVRRELVFAEGDLFSATKIKRSQARVQRLGFFESVDITTTQSDKQNVVDVKVTIVERPTGTFQVGAGFSSVENFIATAQVSQNNLFGRGQNLSLQATLSSIRTLFNLQFTEPYLFDTRWQLSADLYDFEFIFNDFTRSSTGGSLTVGYPLPQPWLDLANIPGDVSVAGTYKLESVDVTLGGRNNNPNRSTSQLFAGGLTSSMRLNLQWDTRDNRLFPTQGFLQNATAEFASDYSFSENEFASYSFDSRWYFPLFWNFVLKFNTEIGVILPLDPDKPVPLFERFFLGGPNSVRGFQRAGLGPTRDVAGITSDPATVLSDFNIGGNKKIVFNAELEFPIFASVGIRGVFFFDMGNAFDDGESFVFTPDLFVASDERFADSLRTAWGFGLRWFSPIGPLRFEWGFPLQPLPGEDPLIFEFSIGNSF